MNLRRKPVLPTAVRAYIERTARRRALLTAALKRLPTGADFCDVLGVGVSTVTDAARGAPRLRTCGLEAHGDEMLADLRRALRARGKAA